MSSLKRPAFDPVLAEVLKQFPKSSGLRNHAAALQRRKAIAPQCEPAATLTDLDIIHEDITIPGSGGDIILTVLRSKNSSGGLRPAFYHIHGGGMVIGNRFFLLSGTFPIIKEFDAVLITVEYRLAPEFPAPAQVEDCYAGLEWVSKNTARLGVDPDKIIISGGSAGAGLAAGCALLARDKKGPNLFAQLLTYPMLDDRVDTVSSKQFMESGFYTGADNVACWDMMLPGTRGSNDVSIYVAPARATDLSGLPPAFIEVGAAEPFRDEDVAYASKLWECGVDAELHVWPGAWHGFNSFAPDAEVSKDAVEARMRWLRRILK